MCNNMCCTVFFINITHYLLIWMVDIPEFNTWLPSCGRNVHYGSLAGKTDRGWEAAGIQTPDIQPLSLHFIGLTAGERLSEHSLSLMARRDKQSYIPLSVLCVCEAEQSLIFLSAFSMSYVAPHHARQHMPIVSSSLLLLRQSCGRFTLMLLIRPGVPRDGFMLLLWRSCQSFLTVGALVLTLAPSLPSDSQRPHSQRRREPRVVPSGIRSKWEGGGPNAAPRDSTSEELLLHVFLHSYPVFYRAVVTCGTSSVSLEKFCTD